MNGRLLALALALAAAAARADGLPDGPPVYVDVRNDQISGVPDTVESYPNEGGLLWVLVRDGYAFPKDCIVVDSKGKHACEPVGNGMSCHCKKIGPHESNAKYKYTIKVVPAQGQPTPPAQDPWIQNK